MLQQQQHQQQLKVLLQQQQKQEQQQGLAVCSRKLQKFKCGPSSSSPRNAKFELKSAAKCFQVMLLLLLLLRVLFGFFLVYLLDFSFCRVCRLLDSHKFAGTSNKKIYWISLFPCSPSFLLSFWPDGEREIGHKEWLTENGRTRKIWKNSTNNNVFAFEPLVEGKVRGCLWTRPHNFIALSQKMRCSYNGKKANVLANTRLCPATLL